MVQVPVYRCCESDHNCNNLYICISNYNIIIYSIKNSKGSSMYDINVQFELYTHILIMHYAPTCKITISGHHIVLTHN